MKKVLFFAALIGLTFSLKAQSITASYNNNQLAEGDTITCIETVDDIHIAPTLHNNTSSAITCRSVAYTLSSNNLDLWTMCAGACVAGTISPEFTINANGDYSGMYAGIMVVDATQNGEAWYRINTYVVGAEGDSTSFIAHVVYNMAGIFTTEVMPAEMVLFPNPSSSIVNVEVSLPQGVNNAIIEVRNLLGQVVKCVPFNGQNANVQMDVSDLTSGVYTAAIQYENKLMSVKKLVVR